jgi:hypothetical protein
MTKAMKILSLLLIFIIFSSTMDSQNMKPLTEQEKKLLSIKGLKLPLRGNFTNMRRREPISAGNVEIHFTIQHQNLTLDAAGQALMKRSRVQ